MRLRGLAAMSFACSGTCETDPNGGDPATGIIERLAQTGGYAIAVPHGSEGDEINR